MMEQPKVRRARVSITACDRWPVEVMWLTGRLEPDHQTASIFACEGSHSGIRE